jgi:hypothetical protein
MSLRGVDFPRKLSSSAVCFPIAHSFKGPSNYGDLLHQPNVSRCPLCSSMWMMQWPRARSSFVAVPPLATFKKATSSPQHFLRVQLQACASSKRRHSPLSCLSSRAPLTLQRQSLLHSHALRKECAVIKTSNRATELCFFLLCHDKNWDSVERACAISTHEAIFIQCCRFKTEAQALKMANDTEYGLAAYFFTKDLSRAFRVAEMLEYGMVGVNETALVSETAPFGGMKQSGLGREHGSSGILEYVDEKHVCLGV